MKIIFRLFRYFILTGFCFVALYSTPLRAVTVQVNVSNFRFTPGTVTVQIGDTVRWNWVNGTHSTTSGTSGNPNGQWDSGIHSPEFSFSHTFDQAGRFPYFCTLHWQMGMIGVVVVKDTNALPPKLENPIKKRIKKGNVKAKLAPIASGMTAPNWGTNAPGDVRRLFITDQIGIIWAIDLVSGQKQVFADLRSLLVALGIGGPNTFDERGLLGLAFHPNYQTNGLLYTYSSENVDGTADFSTLTAGTPANHQSVIREWRVPNPTSSSSVVNSSVSRIILRIDEPQFNHNAGALNFGSDGMMYISIGDGGSADDQGIGHSPQGNGQDRSNVLGKILRINPGGRTSPNGQYSIPSDNPFISSTTGGQAGCADGICDEIFAYGLRNPFRFSFDAANGELYAADVGQNDIEEVDVIRTGNNMGWPLREGRFCFNPNGDDPGFVSKRKTCPADATITSVSQYDHDEGIAIVGGFVYRGNNIKRLRGRYLLGDYARPSSQEGRILYLKKKNIVGRNNIRKSGVAELRLLDRDSLGFFLLGFGQDAQGELYVLGNSTGIPFGLTGGVWKIESP